MEDEKQIPDVLTLGTTGRKIKREDVDTLAAPDKQQLWYETAHNGELRRVFPFYDDAGVTGFGNVVKPFMSRLVLKGLGMTDEELEAERARLFGPLPTHAMKLDSSLSDDIPVMERRKEVFDACARVWYAPNAGEKH
jgi:hypothetical protein